MAKGKEGGRKDPPNFNMVGNPNRKATEFKGIVKEGKNPGITKPVRPPNIQAAINKALQEQDKNKTVDKISKDTNKQKDIQHDKDR